MWGLACGQKTMKLENTSGRENHATGNNDKMGEMKEKLLMWRKVFKRTSFSAF